MGAQPPPRLPAIRRERLGFTLALPFAILLAASFVSWPWRALDIPGIVGTLTPPAIVLLALAIATSMFALRQNLPAAMITWLPAGQGAIVVMTTGFLGGTADAGLGIAAIVAYAFVYLLVLGIAVAVAGDSGKLAIAFVAFFILTQATRFPIFEADVAEPVAFASLFTLLAGGRAVAEIAVLVWLARWLVESPDEDALRPALAIAALTLGHGLIASWEDPLLRGELSVAAAAEQTLRWLMFVTLQLGPALVLIRYRRAWQQGHSP
ncbi:MAG: hypothetical protein IIC32_05610 [Chloroflexi bacterium]|nr:hypothetical protein [Chloroflexota bacterium]